MEDEIRAFVRFLQVQQGASPETRAELRRRPAPVSYLCSWADTDGHGRDSFA